MHFLHLVNHMLTATLSFYIVLCLILDFHLIL